MAKTDREVAIEALEVAVRNNATILALINKLNSVGVKVETSEIQKNAEVIAKDLIQRIKEEHGV